MITILTKLEKIIHRPSELHEIIVGYVLKFDFPGFTTIESCGSLHACRLSLAVLDQKRYKKTTNKTFQSDFGIDLAVSTPCNPYQPSNILAYTIWGVLGRKGVQRPK
jgi:hypothetical protein